MKRGTLAVWLLLGGVALTGCASSSGSVEGDVAPGDVQQEIAYVDAGQDAAVPDITGGSKDSGDAHLELETADLVDIPQANDLKADEITPLDTGTDEGATGDFGPELADLAPDLPPACFVDEPCDDEDPCTFDDECLDSLGTPVCVGTPMDCADDKICTFDWCIDGECSNDMKPGWCFIAGQCFAEGEANPNNACMECVTAAKIYTWSYDDTNVCDDDNMCSSPDTCQGGACAGEPVDCDDQNPCTEDGCWAGECNYIPLNDIPCEDGDLCTIGDYCFASDCKAGDTMRECNDFNICTSDVCSPSEGCIYTPIAGGPCEDGNLCTILDWCQAGQCQPGEDAFCEDENLCTDDSCSPTVGCKYINNALPCDDNDPCSIGDQCFGGACKKGPELNDCNDDNTCTAEWCAPGSGCQYLPLQAACSDKNACTFGDTCVNGECVFEWEKDCEDQNPCTDDTCEGEFGCSNVFNSTPCDDGNACTLDDQCVEGECAPGLFEMECFEENPCASGYCDPAVGCVVTAEDDNPCDDGNQCTLGDMCLAADCVAGAELLGCDDGNPCTKDWCDPDLACLHENIEALCDDLNLCTENDACLDGQCVGSWVDCNDQNQCTLDSCDPWQGCQYSVTVSAWCQPQIIIEEPLRASELLGPPFTVNVKGHIIHNAAPIAWLTINGEEVDVVDDTFSFPFQSVQGLNIIEAEVFDQFDGHDKVVQTFLMAKGYTPMNATNPSVSMIPDGVMVYIGPSVWDDNDAAPNDFATFFNYFIDGMDIQSMIPSPLFENGEYEVKMKNMSYAKPQLDIICINGGLALKVTIPNLKADVDADSKKWYLPDASGDVKVSSIVISMNIMLSVDGAGNVQAKVQNIDSDVNGLNISLDGALGFLLNWIIDFFEGSFASTMEDMLEDTIKDTIPPAIEGALEQLAFDTEFDVPPLFGDAEPITLTMKSGVSTLDFTPAGGAIGLKAAVVAPKGLDVESKGSIHRSGCFTDEGKFGFWMMNELEMALLDDFLNQIPYAMWWAGLLTIPLDPDTLGGGSFEEYGIEDMALVATALLPPVITSCPEGDKLLMQLGDMELAASFAMWGMEVDVIMYVTFEAEIEIGVDDNPPPPKLTMGVTKIKTVELELATVSENLVGSEDSLRLLIKQHVVPLILDQITGGAMASIPLPAFDIGGMVEGVPEGTSLEMTPKMMYRDKGYSTVSGSVHE